MKFKENEEFKYNEHQSKVMQSIFKPETDEYIFYRVYNYKEYNIIFDTMPNNPLIKHISISEVDREYLDENLEDIQKICEHFLGDKYDVISRGIIFRALSCPKVII